ncbi:hypothetical protein ZOSMA_25G01720 [Zostera marina]|uniref:Uncharacterized protein n=1 Tax=Zostera marina TaxID=29655 RepID=A0A0K9PFN8_ZOSMR|nr:hypothetical protein ZOSMA_25G01720 [Zostera marina]
MKNNINDKFHMFKVRNYSSTSEGDYHHPIEIHSSSSKSCSPLLRDFQLLDIPSTEQTTPSGVDLNLDYISPLKSIVRSTNDLINDLDSCHRQISDMDIKNKKHCKSVSHTKSISVNRATVNSSVTDPMSIDLPSEIMSNNVNPNRSVNSVEDIDLNLNYVSPVKRIVRPSFELHNILDLAEQHVTHTDIDIIHRSYKSISITKSIKSMKSLDIVQQSFVTPTEIEMCPVATTSVATVNFPLTIQNSPDFWDSVIRSAEEVETRIRLTRKHTYEDLSTVARCIDFSLRILTPQPTPHMTSITI